MDAPAASAPYASHPQKSRGRRFDEPESATRTCFQRDRDRIIHSGAFRRLQYKTQVFVYHEGDYYRTRLTHSLEVAQIARSIARTLALNEDLAEALALAHDLGHTCFGHAGEDALSECMAPHGGFDHNEQTFRIVTQLEQRYAGFDGLNLTWEMVEGLVKHNGPLLGEGRGPVPESIGRFSAEWDLDLDSQPSAEAQVAALSDDIAYNNHDIDDGLRAGLFSLEGLGALLLVGEQLDDVRGRHPSLDMGRLIHEVIRRLIDAMVRDLVGETRRRIAEASPTSAAEVRGQPRPVVAFSAEMSEKSRDLRDFLFRNMYRHYRVNRMTMKLKTVVRDLFRTYHDHPQCLPEEWRREAEARSGAGRARLVADYIAGMTDRYALQEHTKLFDIQAKT